MKFNHFLAVVTGLLLTGSLLQGQTYSFTTVIQNPATPVRDQANSGTCWCFSTISFLESELLRTGKGEMDLSEMFVVRENYNNRIEDNYLRAGKGNLGQGSIFHMALKAIAEKGIVPEGAYSGLTYGKEAHDHDALNTYLNAIAGAAVQMKDRSQEGRDLQAAVMDIFLGELPTEFTYEGKQHTPQSFWESLELNLDDYIELTSFSHHPYYEPFSLEIPDNWDHETLYNVPLDDLVAIVDHALENGYTVGWDGDVSEAGYHAFFQKGYTLNPKDKSLKIQELAQMEGRIEEEVVTQESRQASFENFTTTDDHLEHITGIATDQYGTRYYITKNSWNTDCNETGGYHNISESYFRGKTVSILVHKAALPKAIRKKLNL